MAKMIGTFPISSYYNLESNWYIYGIVYKSAKNIIQKLSPNNVETLTHIFKKTFILA